ncbi:DgyrCDS4716 [Dimorphilus gyrociliatus]|uniref:DgyrCDS4716 n=1 Tax=Dimorphilus gyrociliatus TaxID=2664684 RepID=A0A7I8VHU9_9ANNE|nr:DgyrCDS4716 [Dimorphilus gyrociliatus]
MAAIVRVCKNGGILSKNIRLLSLSLHRLNEKNEAEAITHTGQQYSADDYRRARFEIGQKIVTKKFAIDMIREDPVVVSENRVVWSDSGGALGHPKVYINLDKPGVHTCGYSGRKFVNKKYYDEKTMGPSISYDEYLSQVRPKAED